jgi:hypothetical protein
VHQGKIESALIQIGEAVRVSEGAMKTIGETVKMLEGTMETIREAKRCCSADGGQSPHDEQAGMHVTEESSHE